MESNEEATIKTDFKAFIKEIDEMTESQMSSSAQMVCDAIKDKFEGNTLEEALDKLSELEQQMVLMIFNLVFPEKSKVLDSLSAIKLDGFKTAKKIHTFVEAFIKSGIAADIERSVNIVIGPTGAGKTSLVNTLKDYIENPSDEPRSMLTEDHEHLRETQVLQVYDDISLQSKNNIVVELSGSNLTLVTFQDTSEAETNKSVVTKQKNMKLIDLGGHQEQGPEKY
jgi:predicted Ser/Thr protein kinase